MVIHMCHLSTWEGEGSGGEWCTWQVSGVSDIHETLSLKKNQKTKKPKKVTNDGSKASLLGQEELCPASLRRYGPF